MCSNWIRSGLCLAFFALGCGPPVFRLEGQIPIGAAQVSLLDSTASFVVDSLRAYFQNGDRAVRNWYPGEQVVDVDFSSEAEYFLNINHPKDMDAGI